MGLTEDKPRKPNDITVQSCGVQDERMREIKGK